MGGRKTGRLELGWIAGAHGVHGAVKVRLWNPDSTALREGARVWLHARDDPNEGQEYTVVSHRPMPKDHVRTELAGVNTRESAEALRGRGVAIDRGQLDPLPDDEFYLADLVGRSVRSAQGVSLGSVVALSSNGVQELMEVSWRDGDGVEHRWLMPIVSDLVLEIGAESDTPVIVDPPVGMMPDALDDEVTRTASQGPVIDSSSGGG